MNGEAFEGRSALFLTPCFLARRMHKEIRGVEVFDLLLVRRLVELGVRVTIGAEHSWKGRLERHLAGAMPEALYTPNLFKPLWNGLALAPRLAGRRFDALLLGNVGNGLGTAARLIRPRCAHVALIAHRPPRAPFLRSLRGRPIDVVAVNPQIGAAFAGEPGCRVTVRYGVPNAERFHPPAAPRPTDAPTRFVVVGKLDTAMKRADRAISAFHRLPPDVRARCELHLAGYPAPPQNLGEGVTAYGWRSVDEIAALLRDMDVCLVPSDPGETFSQALVQAMLTGLPAIVSDLPPLVEKVRDGAGLVFRSDEELTGAMARLAASPGERLAKGQAARRIALERYVWDTAWFAREHLFQPR